MAIDEGNASQIPAEPFSHSSDESDPGDRSPTIRRSSRPHPSTHDLDRHVLNAPTRAGPRIPLSPNLLESPRASGEWFASQSIPTKLPSADSESLSQESEGKGESMIQIGTSIDNESGSAEDSSEQEEEEEPQAQAIPSKAPRRSSPIGRVASSEVEATPTRSIRPLDHVATTLAMGSATPSSSMYSELSAPHGEDAPTSGPESVHAEVPQGSRSAPFELENFIKGSERPADQVYGPEDVKGGPGPADNQSAEIEDDEGADGPVEVQLRQKRQSAIIWLLVLLIVSICGLTGVVIWSAVKIGRLRR